MQRRLNVNREIFFLIEDDCEKTFTEDDVDLSIVIQGEKYFIERDSYQHEIKHMLLHFCETSNIMEIGDVDLAQEYFEYQSGCGINDELYKYDNYLAFSSHQMVVLFYKKKNNIFCHVTQNDWGKTFTTLCKASLDKEVLSEWKDILDQAVS